MFDQTFARVLLVVHDIIGMALIILLLTSIDKPHNDIPKWRKIKRQRPKQTWYMQADDDSIHVTDGQARQQPLSAMKMITMDSDFSFSPWDGRIVTAYTIYIYNLA